MPSWQPAGRSPHRHGDWSPEAKRGALFVLSFGMRSKTESLSPLSLAGLALLALVPRIANLGSFSLWLDEIIETNQASGTLLQLLAALRADAVHPPLEAVISWLALHAGLGESARRLVPIAFGIATILIVARWVARRFGRTEGLLVGVAMALAPFHVHYSQELRPYSLALLCAALSLSAADRLLESLNPVRVVAFFFAVLATLYTHYLSFAILAPLAWLGVERAFGAEGETRRRARRLLAASPLFMLGWCLAYAPWLRVMLDARQQKMQRPPTRWRSGVLIERWHELTLGTESHVLGWIGLFALALVGLGIWRSAQSAEGRATLAGAVAGTVGVEILLQRSGHWSEARYMLIGWLFLAILLGLGLAELCRRVHALTRRPALRLELLFALFAAFAFASATGIVYDYAHRSDWLWVARVIAVSAQAGEPVFALNASTEMSLGHYLGQAVAESSGKGRAPIALISLDGSFRRLRANWPANRGALLVRRGRGRGAEVIQALHSRRTLAEDGPTKVKIWHLSPGDRPNASPAGGEATQIAETASIRPKRSRAVPPEMRPRPERWEPLSRFLLGLPKVTPTKVDRAPNRSDKLAT